MGRPRNQEMFFLKIDLDLHWGFSSRPLRLSKTRDSYLLPPPTTVIGALSYGYAVTSKLPEELGESVTSTSELLRKHVVSVNLRVRAPLHHYSDLSRIWWYRSKEKKVKFDAVALGKTYTSPHRPPTITAVVVIDLARGLGVKELVTAAYSIARVGAKEGVASVRGVSYGYAKELGAGEVRTRYSLWLDLARAVEGTYYAQEVIDYRRARIGDYAGAPLRTHAYPYNAVSKEPTVLKVMLDRSAAKPYLVDGEVVVIER